MRVKKLPMILALHLKRFKYMEQLHRYTKLSYRVVFPLELRLFNTSGDAVNLDRMYDLVAVVVHCGRYSIPINAFLKSRYDGSEYLCWRTVFCINVAQMTAALPEARTYAVQCGSFGNAAQ